MGGDEEETVGLVHIGWFRGTFRIIHAYLSSSARHIYLSSIHEYISTIAQDPYQVKDALLEFFDDKRVNMVEVNRYLEVAEQLEAKIEIQTGEQEILDSLTNEILISIRDDAEEEISDDQATLIRTKLTSCSDLIKCLIPKILSIKEATTMEIFSDYITDIDKILTILAECSANRQLEIFNQYFLHHLSEYIIEHQSDEINSLNPEAIIPFLIKTISDTKKLIVQTLIKEDKMEGNMRDHLNLIVQILQRFLVDRRHNKVTHHSQYELPIFSRIPKQKTDDTEEQPLKIRILRTRKLEKVICLGGGAKGCVLQACTYPFYKYLHIDEKNITTVFGISVGSIAGSFLATCTQVDQVEKLLNNFSLQQCTQLMHSDVCDRDIYYHYPSLTVSHDLSNMQSLINCVQSTSNYRDGMLFVHEIARQLSQNIRDSLSNEWNTEIFQERFSVLDDKQKTRLTLLKNVDMTIYNYTNNEETNVIRLQNPKEHVPIEKILVTFEDLQLLHQMMPNKCKRIEILATNLSTSGPELLNAEKNPDMPIVYAIRASMSLPLMLYPVEYEQVKYSDGGISDLTAVPSFKDLDSNTVIIGYYDNPDTESPGIANKLVSKLTCQVVRNPHYTKVCKMYSKWKSTHSDILIDLKHDGVDTFDLHASPQAINKAQLSAQETLEEYIELHGDELRADEYENFQMAIASLSEEEKAMLLSQTGENYYCSYGQDMQLYEEIVACIQNTH